MSNKACTQLLDSSEPRGCACGGLLRAGFNGRSTCVQSAGQAARAEGVPSPARRRELAGLKQEHEAALSGMQARCVQLEQELVEGRAIWGEARWAGYSPPTAALLALQSCPGGLPGGLLHC